MSIVDGNWKTFMARASVLSAMLGVVVFGAVKLAVADPGGPTSPQLTFAGVLRDASGALPTTARLTTLTFTFTKTGASPCAVTVPDVRIAVGGAFTAPVSIASCPSYFDGSNVSYTVAEGTTVLTPDGGAAITPVPYARFADQVGVNNECPAGYSRATTVGAPVLCLRGNDQVVRVGTGASAFWIDRFEANVNSSPDGTGTYFFLSDGDFPTTAFPRNGQWRRSGVAVSPVFAVSITGASVARWITWFQASEACRASGKRLPTGEEWLLAANGSEDPGANDGLAVGNTRCNTMGAGPRNTGLGAGCTSGWGAQDMIGNLHEMTAEWFAGAGSALSIAARTISVNSGTGTVTIPAINPDRFALLPNWPAGYGGDGIANVNGTADRGDAVPAGIPSVALRGGAYNDGTSAGVFYLNLNTAPSNWHDNIGFRCVIPR